MAGPPAARGGVLFIDRDRLRALPGTAARFVDLPRAGRAVAVFPEGGTTPPFVGDDSLFASVGTVVTTRGPVAEVGVREAIAPGRHGDRRPLALAAQRDALPEPSARHPVLESWALPPDSRLPSGQTTGTCDRTWAH